MKAMLGGLTAIHSAGRIYGVNPARSLAGLPSSMTIRYTEEAHGEIEHPVVRTHVETGRKCLFVNGNFCRAETEDGLYGWGEAYVTQGKEKVVAECIRAMAPHGIGRCAFNIRHTAIAEPSAHYRCDMTPRWRERDSNSRSLVETNREIAPSYWHFGGSPMMNDVSSWLATRRA
jgi:hypothetical protein